MSFFKKSLGGLASLTDSHATKETGVGGSGTKGTQALLKWCQNATQGYPGVKVVDFDSSWQDGLAFCALIHHFHPHLIPFDSLKPQNKQGNFELAFKKAEELGIPALLDVEDMLLPQKPDRLSIITYLSTIYHHFTKTNAAPSLLKPPEAGGRFNNNAPPPLVFKAPPNLNRDKRQSIVVGAGDETTRPLCGKCKLPLSGAVVEGAGSMFHANCFVCTECNKPLQGRCMNVKNQPYCPPCGKKAFSSNFQGMPVMGLGGGPPPGLQQRKQEQELQRQLEKQEQEEKENRAPGEIIHRTRERPMGPAGRRLPKKSKPKTLPGIEATFGPSPSESQPSLPTQTKPFNPNPTRTSILREASAPLASPLPSLPPKPKNTPSSAPIVAPTPAPSSQISESLPPLPSKPQPSLPQLQPSGPSQQAMPTLPVKPKQVPNEALEEDSTTLPPRPIARRSTVSTFDGSSRSSVYGPPRPMPPKAELPPLPARASVMSTSGSSLLGQTSAKSGSPTSTPQVPKPPSPKGEFPPLPARAPSDGSVPRPEQPPRKALPPPQSKGFKSTTALERRSSRPATLFVGGTSNANTSPAASSALTTVRRDKIASMWVPETGLDQILELRREIAIDTVNKAREEKNRNERERIAAYLEKKKTIPPEEFQRQQEEERKRKEAEMAEARRKREEEIAREKERKSMAIRKRLTVLDERSSIMDFLKGLSIQEQLQEEANTQQSVPWQPPPQEQTPPPFQQAPSPQQNVYQPQHHLQQSYQQQPPQQPPLLQQSSPYSQPQHYPQPQGASSPQVTTRPPLPLHGASSSPKMARPGTPSNVHDIPEDELVEDVERYVYEERNANRLEGFLLKQNATGIFNIARNRIGLGTWTKKWFTLQDDKLAYYDDKVNNTTGRDCPPSGIILLTAVDAIEAVDQQPAVTFKIITSEETYFLEAATTEEMHLWVICLLQAKQYYDALKQANDPGRATEMSGWLEKRGPFNLFYRRYFVLRNGILYRYRTGGEKGVLGKIPLYGARFNEYMPDSYESTFEVVAKEESIVLRAPSDEVMHQWLNALLKQKLMIEEAVSCIILP